MLREKVFPNQSSFRRVNQPGLVKLRLLTNVGVHAQEAAQLQRRCVTNLSRPVVSHTDRVLVISVFVGMDSENNWSPLGDDKDLFVCTCNRKSLAALLACSRGG